MKEKKKHPNEVFEYDLINSSAALPHFYCSYSLSGSASCYPPPTSTLGELAHRFFFFFSPREIKELSLCRRFFSPSRWVEKKRKNDLIVCVWQLHWSPQRKERKKREGEKKRSLLLWAQQTSNRSTTHLLKLRLWKGRPAAPGKAGNRRRRNLRRWSANCRAGYYGEISAGERKDTTSGQLKVTPCDAGREKIKWTLICVFM